MIERSLGQRAPVLWLLVPTMVGFALARALPAGWGGGWWFAAAAIGLGWACRGVCGPERPGRAVWAPGVVLAVGAAAVACFQLRENRLAVWARLPAREAELVLEIERVFPSAAGRVTTTGLARITAAPAVVAETVGQRVYFSVRAPAEAEWVRSAQVRVLGVLAPLPRDAATGFDGYLVSAGAAFKFNRARWLAQERGAHPYRRFCAAAARRLECILGLGLEDRPAWRSIHVAMLLGRKAELGGGQRELFMNSGTMHLFAISGLHIAVIWAVLAGLLGALRVPRPAVALAGLPALWLYVEITGGAPSARRAWLMIAFVIAAKALRWARNPLAGIAASALVVLWWAPWQLFGLGFQMSYAVVAALLLYGLPLEERLQRRWRPWADLPQSEWGWGRRAARWLGAQVISGFALAVAATLVSVPMTLANFGLLTPASLVVNLACIPAASLAIVAGIVSILAGLLGMGPVSVFLNHASAVLIAGMERGLTWAMRVPGAYWPAEYRAEWLGPAILVVLLTLLVAGYALRWRRRFGGAWMPVAVVVLALAVLARHGGAEAPPAAASAPANLPAAGATAIAPGP